MLITLADGRTFPAYEGEPLSWSVGLYLTHAESWAGYPRARAVVLAMQTHQPEQLARERLNAVRGSFGIFKGNAEALLRVIDSVTIKPHAEDSTRDPQIGVDNKTRCV